MAVLLLLLAVAISFIVVRIGAAALELTGMSWEHAKFQALSAFTNAGFTTTESEEITHHPLRRRVVSLLIVLGNAGLVATVGSFAGSVLEPHPLSFLVNVGAMILGLALLLWVARRPRLAERLRRSARDWLDRRYSISDYAPADLLHLNRGFCLTRFEIMADSPAVARSLRQLRLKQNTVQVLAIERDGRFLPAPAGEDVIQPGDRLVVYGKDTSIERLFEPSDAGDLLIVEESDGETPLEAMASTP